MEEADDGEVEGDDEMEEAGDDATASSISSSSSYPMRKVELLAVTREWEESALRSKARFSRKRKEQLFYSRRAQDIRRRTSPQDITLILVAVAAAAADCNHWRSGLLMPQPC